MKFEVVEEDMHACHNIPTQKRREHSIEISRKEISELRKINTFKAF